ncbi:hypothetical protein C1Y40_04970 [Mycobacterium talmoniae]|uniref:Uncharacterized protein n=1 Tax=Mycobacterium talmoniae TaxID=1858794 RepID=A0A2S8BE05_9MYCO|nr:hypothetical protein C1Y40_04970 [Mycobacterium talmoniae]
MGSHRFLDAIGLGGLMSVVDLIDWGLGLFGDDDDDDDSQASPAPPYPGTTPGAGPYPEMPGWNGSSADAEKQASDDLVKKTAELTALDEAMAGLAAQIVDDNDEAKKKLLQLKGEIDSELEYAKSSGDSSVVKDEAVNKFLQDKASEVAKVISDAGASVAKRKAEITGVGNQYPGGTGIGSGAGSGEIPPDLGMGAGSYGGYPDPYGMGGGGYEDPYYEDPGYGATDPGDLADTAAGLLPQVASALPGALGGVGAGPLSGLGGLGSLGDLIGSAVRDGGRREDEGLNGPDEGEGKGTKDWGQKENNENKGNSENGNKEQNNEGQPAPNGSNPNASPAPAPRRPDVGGSPRWQPRHGGVAGAGGGCSGPSGWCVAGGRLQGGGVDPAAGRDAGKGQFGVVGVWAGRGSGGVQGPLCDAAGR